MGGFGERLRMLRKAKGYSLDDLASKTNISRAYLWKLEKKPAANPSLDRLEKLAEALETSVGELVGSSRPTQSDEIPASLRACQERFDIPQEDIKDLAQLRFRGGQPTDPEDWYLLYLQLKRAMGAEEA